MARFFNENQEKYFSQISTVPSADKPFQPTANSQGPNPEIQVSISNLTRVSIRVETTSNGKASLGSIPKYQTESVGVFRKWVLRIYFKAQNLQSQGFYSNLFGARII
ncbi:hypothetical protein OnM2_035070 [Erysiphe neolycopersici]|uniref:Uncharacterized protein n=1 Tax=Erysiphe neolycopersici TaxID=212602 RepID=A0A420HXI0_9PEZI|nr:hypothetical protein OnM2_035070 [Erysiphe neolycopersici]